MTLKSNLVSLWTMPSGIDIVGTNNLSGNLPNAVAGLFSENAGDFVAANSDMISLNDADNLKAGNTNFSMGCWVRLSSTSTGADKQIFNKWRAVDNERAYILQWQMSANRFVFTVGSFNGTSTGASVSANNFGAPASNGVEWCYVYAYHDATNDEVGISVNNGVRKTTVYSSGVALGRSHFSIGALNFYGNAYNLMDGDVQQPAFWREVKTTEDIASIYNNGLGLAYSAWDVPVVSNNIYTKAITGNDIKNGGAVLFVNERNTARLASKISSSNIESTQSVLNDRFDDPQYYNSRE